MAFPSDLEIEVAFNNDIDETDYAQTGWTSILPFVASFDGDLRGRSYELDRAEAGTLNVTLDNGDGRFIPGSVGSPYYPYVKSDRRFRIRGKNMVHPNVARGGGRDRDTTGLVNTPQDATMTGPYSFIVSTKALDSAFEIYSSAENPPLEGANNLYDGYFSTKWSASTSTADFTYNLASPTVIRSYTLTSADTDPTRDPKSWFIRGTNDFITYTTLDTRTGEVFDDRWQTKEYTIATPGPAFKYYGMVITANNGGTGLHLADWTLGHLPTDTYFGDGDLSHYFQVKIPVNQPTLNSNHRTIGWFAPLEYGTRLTHSMYFWRIFGTEPTGTKIKFEMVYFDSTWTEITSSVTQEISTLPTSQLPTRLQVSHTPPPTAKYGVLTFTVVLGSTTNSTDLVYGVTGIQSELPSNLAPDISGFRDQYNWQVEGDGTGTTANVGTDPTTSYLEVTWGTDNVNVGTTIPHLIPGEIYTATVEAQKIGTQPDVMFSADEGQTGPIISSTSFATYTTTFTASRAETELQFITQGSTVPGAGLRLRKLNVQLGSGPVSLATSAIETGVTTWARPKDIFEGWVESWPVRAGGTEMSITVVDRMKRLGAIELENTLEEAIFQDRPQLLMPLSDSMLDTPGRFSQLGSWGDQEGGPSYVDIGSQRVDLGTSSYTTNTDDGPTGAASLKLSPQSTGATSVGYFMPIPYTRDYIPKVDAPPPLQPSPRPPKPPAPNNTRTYTKTWYATWSRSYEGDNSTRFNDPPTMYQGSYDSSSPGNQKSLAGFDYKNIMSTLSGAEILEAYITVKNDHARWNKGLYVFTGTHSYSSKPGTWSSGSVKERRWKKWIAEGASTTINIGVSAGKEFKAGTARGISIGPEPTNDHDNYGYFRGASQSGKPYLTIKYRK